MLNVPSVRNFYDFLSFAVSYKVGYAVPVYSSVEEISADLSKLTWTQDPVEGKLDVIKHPTFMRKAILKHPAYSGDCDDFASYFCAALLKSNLVEFAYFCSASWLECGKRLGHAVCVYRLHNGDVFWVSNWNSCKPMKLTAADKWVEALQKYQQNYSSCRVNVTHAYMHPVIKLVRDTPILGTVHVVRFNTLGF